jgi:hypothetical protein
MKEIDKQSMVSAKESTLIVQCQNCNNLVRLSDEKSYTVCSVCGKLNKYLTKKLGKYLAFKNQDISNYTYCACPDHEIMPVISSRGRPLKYINGHHVKWRIGNKNPMFGKHHTSEVKERMRLAASHVWVQRKKTR